MAKQGSENPPEQDKTFSSRQTEQYQEDKKKLIAPFHGARVPEHPQAKLRAGD